MSSSAPRLVVATDRALLLVGSERRVLREGAFTDVASDPGGGFWAISGRELFRGGAEGLHPIARVAAELTAVSVFQGAVYLGVEGPSLWRFTDRLAEVPSFARTEGHEEWHQPFPAPPRIRSFAATARALYVNVHVGGVLVSTDGERFAPSGFDLHDDAHEVRADGERVWLAAAGGLWSSEDGARTFRLDHAGLPLRYLRACAISDRFVFVSAASGPFAETGTVHRRPLSGGRFEACTRGVPAQFPGIVDTHCLDARGRFVAIGSPDGAVYLSQNEGGSFTQVASGSSAVRSLRFCELAAG